MAEMIGLVRWCLQWLGLVTNHHKCLNERRSSVVHMIRVHSHETKTIIVRLPEIEKKCQLMLQEIRKAIMRL